MQQPDIREKNRAEGPLDAWVFIGLYVGAHVIVEGDYPLLIAFAFLCAMALVINMSANALHALFGAAGVTAGEELARRLATLRRRLPEDAAPENTTESARQSFSTGTSRHVAAQLHHSNNAEPRHPGRRSGRVLG